MSSLFLALFSVLVWTVSSVELQSIAEKVNLLQKQWKAETNERFSQMSREEKAALLGVRTIELPVRGRLNPSPTRHFNVSIPETFDAREHWADCASLKRIRDQSKCGSCWAFAAVETLSDRLCIYSKGDIQVTLSADDLLSCCGDACGYGCEGGYPLDAWEYFVKTGVVTGDAYDSNLGCRPYPFPPCSGANYSHYQSCKDSGVFDTPKCEKKCESSYTTSYDNDKFYSLSAYGVKADEESIQKEIISRGPVEVAFDVYEDFYDYKSGVYQYTTGDFVGGHAVKMIGWGVEDSVKYWLIANSWDTVWGEKGFFKIIRGINELGIEGGVVGGEPKIPAKKSEKEPH